MGRASFLRRAALAATTGLFAAGCGVLLDLGDEHARAVDAGDDAVSFREPDAHRDVDATPSLDARAEAEADGTTPIDSTVDAGGAEAEADAAPTVAFAHGEVLATFDLGSFVFHEHSELVSILDVAVQPDGVLNVYIATDLAPDLGVQRGPVFYQGLVGLSVYTGTDDAGAGPRSVFYPTGSKAPFRATSADQRPDGVFVATGYSFMDAGPDRYGIFEYSAAGDLLWSRETDCAGLTFAVFDHHGGVRVMGGLQTSTCDFGAGPVEAPGDASAPTYVAGAYLDDGGAVWDRLFDLWTPNGMMLTTDDHAIASTPDGLLLDIERDGGWSTSFSSGAMFDVHGNEILAAIPSDVDGGSSDFARVDRATGAVTTHLAVPEYTGGSIALASDGTYFKYWDGIRHFAGDGTLLFSDTDSDSQWSLHEESLKTDDTGRAYVVAVQMTKLGARTVYRVLVVRYEPYAP
jgi:hypothetical protein